MVRRPMWFTDTRVPFKVLQVVSVGVVAAALMRPEVALAASSQVSVTSVDVSAPAKATGVVKGTVHALSGSGGKVSFSVAKPANGSVSITPNGAFTYTPTPAARHAAAKVGAWFPARRDIVPVTVTDPSGRQATVSVRVPILGANKPPVATVSIGTPDPTTGVVTGSVTAVDPDGDPLTYSAPPNDSSSSSKGSIAVNAATGAFTYTPTAAAVRARGGGGASARSTDSFTVTVSDGHGGTVAVPVVVPWSGGVGTSAPQMAPMEP